VFLRSEKECSIWYFGENMGLDNAVNRLTRAHKMLNKGLSAKIKEKSTLRMTARSVDS